MVVCFLRLRIAVRVEARWGPKYGGRGEIKHPSFFYRDSLVCIHQNGTSAFLSSVHNILRISAIFPGPATLFEMQPRVPSIPVNHPQPGNHSTHGQSSTEQRPVKPKERQLHACEVKSRTCAKRITCWFFLVNDISVSVSHTTRTCLLPRLGNLVIPFGHPDKSGYNISYREQFTIVSAR